uniref:Otopetrin 3 n=1 Tax=Sander lucioperca TaxID=283035 RepID=A0A8D0DA30_SANLU
MVCEKADPKHDKFSDACLHKLKRLISGMLGLNVVLLGAALLIGESLPPEGLKHQEPQVFLLLLMGVSSLWMLWYLLWARKHVYILHSVMKCLCSGPGVLMLFAAFSLLLHMFKAGYLMIMMDCKPVVEVISPFIEAPFIVLQVMTLATSRSESGAKNQNPCLLPGTANSTLCDCSASAACLAFRKGYEILYPFNMEYYLMACCMIYVMWKNVGRRMSPGPHHVAQKLTIHVVYHGGIICGLVFGALVLMVGLAVFILYQVWVSQDELRFTAFLLFYGYHLVVMPLMSVCSLAGMLVHRLERRANEAGHNPTRSLDVMLLVAAAMGQFALSYFSLVAAMAVGTSGLLGELDLSYSLLSLLQLILQNIFIIQGLHRHPSLLAKKKEKQRRILFKVPAINLFFPHLLQCYGNMMCVYIKHKKYKFLCYFGIHKIHPCSLFLQLWVIPAFGVHPQFENGLGKQFFGFSAWFVLVNLGQPLSVFYRMHSVGALMELLISA